MRPLLLFAHGAGAGVGHRWMRSRAQRLDSVGEVRTFDYPYIAAGKRRPDHRTRLVAAHRDALNEARAGHQRPVFLIGKSMGSRMGCHLSLKEPVDGLICMGYPLVSPGKSRALRDEILIALQRPILFVQGTRDRLCPLETMAQVRPRMSAANTLHVVETGDHSLLITKTHTKKTGTTQEDADAAALEAIRRFVLEETR